MLAGRKYTFVTVAHEEDWEVLRLQARSMHLYLPGDLVAEIIVIENSTSPALVEFRRVLWGEYGNLAGKVRFRSAGEIAAVPDHTEGWLSQQILKLMIATEVATDRYVLLDAKNHLVFPLQRNFLEVANKIPSWLENYETHVMRPYLERSVRYFGMNPDQCLRAFPPTITPYTLPTALVRDLVRSVVERERKAFPVAFLDLGFCEFFLFAAFIGTLGKTDELYDFSGMSCPIIWESDAISGVKNLKHQIAHAEEYALPFFAVHRRAVQWLDDRSRGAIAEFWHRRCLFPTISDGLDFLSSRTVFDELRTCKRNRTST